MEHIKEWILFENIEFENYFTRESWQNYCNNFNLPFSKKEYDSLANKINPKKFTKDGMYKKDYPVYNNGLYFDMVMSGYSDFKLLDWVKKSPKLKDKELKLCDLGCGLGTVMYFAKKIGYNVIGVEYKKSLKVFHDKLKLDVIYGDFFKIDLSFLKDIDVIYMYRPISDLILAEKLLDLIYTNTKEDVIIVYYDPHILRTKKFKEFRTYYNTSASILQKF